MNDSEWSQAQQTFRELFPKGAKELTAAQWQAWRDTLSSFGLDHVRRALRRHYETCKFAPKPGEIRQKAASEARQAENQNRPEQAYLLKMRQEHREAWQTADALLADLTEAEMEQHKQTLLATDWRFAWMADAPVTSIWWRALIVRRLKARLSPDQPGPDEVPPRPEAGGGDLVAEQLLDAL